MARLFRKEYHEVSNTWTFKEKQFNLNNGDLSYQITLNEKGHCIIRFRAKSASKALFSSFLIIYDRRREKVISHKCGVCSANGAAAGEAAICSHYLSVIDYAYKYLSTDILSGVDKMVYTGNILKYDEYHQSEAINGKIILQRVFDSREDKVRFYFSGYHGFDLYPVSLLAAGKELPPGQDEQEIERQADMLTEAEVSLLGILQKIKIAHVVKKQMWSVRKNKFAQALPLLQVLSKMGKVFIEETGDRLEFSDDEFQLHLRVEPADSFYSEAKNQSPENSPQAVETNVEQTYFESGSEARKYLLRPGKSCFYSTFFVGNITYVLVENCVYSLRLPFFPGVTEKILSGDYYCSEEDIVYLATVVARQLSMAGHYLDIDESISLPEHYTGEPQVVFKLRSCSYAVNDEHQSPNAAAKAIKLSCCFDYGKDQLKLDRLAAENSLIAITGREGRRKWFYLSEHLYQEVAAFLEQLPLPDINRLDEDGYCLYFVEHKLDQLKQVFYEQTKSEWKVDLDEKLKKEFIYKVEIQPLIKTLKGEDIDWFDYQVEYKVRDITFTHDEMKAFFSNNRKYMKLPDGEMVYIANKKTYDSIDKHISYLERQRSSTRIAHYNLSYLYALAQNNPEIKIEGDSYLENMYSDLLRRKLRQHTEVPLSLFNIMRSYQKSGFKWMKMLQRYKLAGVLADDMGLGKTLQAIALLADYYHKEDTLGDSADMPPSLVVCPKTLLYNWAAEIGKFHSNLAYCIYEGAKKERQKLVEDNQYELIIASYALVSSDLELFSKRRFGYIILDEAQHIKNPNSQRSKAVKKLQAEHRLALTGTPLENNIRELWSIFDFLMPGYLMSLRKFKKTFEIKTVNNSNIRNRPERKDAVPLNNLIAPFMLRRRKKEVLLELPDKQEQFIYCRMTPQQEKLYLKIIAMAKSTLLPELQADTKNPRIYINVLAALTKMRQVCNHPGLLEEELADKHQTSAKMELLGEVIQDALENNRNILVFSQFAAMLRRIAGYLQDKDILFEYLDGQTRNRNQVIENFCNNDNIRIFLLTLKVGGLGLNLTKADTVIMVDPWWNPMAENQSIDRTHRIGQTKKVLVYKAITKGTLEEKIIRLQTEKKDLFNKIVEGGEAVMSKLSIEGIKSLFEYERL